MNITADVKTPYTPYKPPTFSVPKSYVDRWPFIKRYQALWLEGMTWYPTWKEQAKLLNPTRGFFLNDVPNRGRPIDHITLIDGVARRYIRDFASGMISGMSSPSRKWREMEIEDKDLMKYQPVKLYFQEVNRSMDSVSAHSNMYDGLHNVYEEIVTFGTAASMLMEDYEDVIRMRNFTIGEYFLGAGQDCRVNGFTRSFWMQVSQLVSEFGIDNCSPQVQAMFYNQQPDNWRKVIQLIEVNDDRVPEYQDFKNKHTRSLYWEDGSQQNTFLRLEGFDEFPVQAPRWQTRTTADVYGRSPGWDCLGDSSMLQMMQKKKLIALDKIVDPPLQVDSAVGIVNTLPGGITRTSQGAPNAGVKPTYQVQIDLNAVREDIMEVKKALADAFFNDLFKMILGAPENPDETAYAVAEKQSERLNMLSPIVNKLNNEQLNPMNLRQYNIMLRAGLFPPMPKELRGQKLQVKYTSVLAQAQRMAGIAAKQQVLGFITEMGNITSQTGKPAIDILNTDNITRNYSQEVGLEADEINPADAVDSTRQQRQAQQEQQAKVAQAQASADIAAKTAKAAKDTATAPMGTGSALDSLLSGFGQQGHPQ